MLNVTVGDVIEGKVADFASEGEGIVKIGSYAVFVPFAIKGETVRARIRFAKKDYAFAELVEVALPSPDRDVRISGVAAVAIFNTSQPSASLQSRKQALKTRSKKSADLTSKRTTSCI